MSASYKICKTNFNSGDKKYHASVQYNEVMTDDDIIDMMMVNGSPITRADTQAVISKYHDTINLAASNGWQVVTRSARYGFTIKGVFTGPQDQFDRSRHKVVPLVQAGSGFKEVVESGIPMEKEATYKKQPELDVYVNLYNGSPDSELTPGHNARILGNRLRFDPADPEQGLFVVPIDAAGLLNLAEAVRVEEFTRVTPKEITFRVPDNLSPGLYKLRVQAKYGKSGLRTGELEDVLTVI
ncbi:MAG: DUF4469 domain-containing protein [Anaerolineales bacterium]|nr:DUF4469 domain-containing protein [Anaerolineales bacterium]